MCTYVDGGIYVYIAKQFRWTMDSEPVPGWVLTQPWITGTLESIKHFLDNCVQELLVTQQQLLYDSRRIIDVLLSNYIIYY